MKVQQTLVKQALHRLFGNIRGGSFRVSYRDGTKEYYGEGKPQFVLRIDETNTGGLLSDDLLTGFGEAYMNGQIDVEGDLADLIAIAIRSGWMSVVDPAPSFGAMALNAKGFIRSLKREKENIAHHYDLGNDFFRLWLDDSMTYSCAYFSESSDPLEEAQRAKNQYSLKKLRLKADDSLLDIGCGWGGLTMQAAEQFGAVATGITLSEEQHTQAERKIASRGLSGRAEVRLMHYEPAAAEGKQYDKIVSIGMIEHVGKEHLNAFARSVETLLKPGGLALLHLITGTTEGPVNRWVEKYIFPGGYLPTLPEMIEHLSAQNLRVWDVENLAPHYRLTLDEWSRRFEIGAPTVRAMFDERFVRMWRLYLRASSAAFREGSIEVHQILVSRGQPLDLPLTRDDICR